MTEFEKLSATERRILQLIVGDPTANQTAIAKKLKLTRQHVSTLLNLAPLRTAIAEMQRAQLEETTRIVVAASTNAVSALARIVNDPTATNSDVVKAARVLLEFRMRDLPEKPRSPERYVVTIDEDGIVHQEKQEWDGKG